MGGNQQAMDEQSNVPQVTKRLDEMALKKEKWSYAVCNGRQNGVCNEWSVAGKLVTGYPDNIHAKYKTRKEAEARINEYEETLDGPGGEDKRYALLVGKEVGVYKNWEDMKPNFMGYDGARYVRVSDESEGFNYIEKYEATLKRPGGEDKRYALLVGKEVGVYKNWEDMKPNFMGYDGARYVRVSDESEGFNYIEKYEATLKRPGGEDKRYALLVGKEVGVYKNWEDMKPNFMGYDGARYVRVSDESEGFNYIEKYEATLKRPGGEDKRYALLVGKEVGVYKNWEDMKPNFMGYDGARYVRTLKEEEDYGDSEKFEEDRKGGERKVKEKSE